MTEHGSPPAPDRPDRNDRMALVVFGDYEAEPPIPGLRQRQDASDDRLDKLEATVGPLELWIKLVSTTVKYVGVPGTLGALFVVIRYFTDGGPMP